MAELWRGLCSLAPEECPEAAEDRYTPRDPSLVLGRLEALGVRVSTLKEEWRRSEETCQQLTHTVETLQGKEHLFCLTLYGRLFNLWPFLLNSLLSLRDNSIIHN